MRERRTRRQSSPCTAPAEKAGGAQRSSEAEAVRRFNRFYTSQLGLLDEGLLHSPFSLTEARVLYELAGRERTTATTLARELRLDPGYLSRLLRRLQQRGLLERSAAPDDGRRQLVGLTRAGQRAFAQLDAASHAQIQGLLDGLPDDGRRRLLGAMRSIESLLGAPGDRASPFLLRTHGPGDMGWIVHRQALLYQREHGWNASYEALIARIVADFLDGFDAARERCWIAERDGEIVGSVFVVRHPEREGVARLRLLYVEPSARGLGIGRRLVEEVTRFARQAGYCTVTLWTNSVLVAARRLYVAEGYRLVAEEPHHSFGRDLVGQTWELRL